MICYSATLKEKLQEHFEQHMKSDKVPLLKDFGTYQKSLPTREFRSGKLRLYEYPFMVKKEDLQLMVEYA